MRQTNYRHWGRRTGCGRRRRPPSWEQHQRRRRGLRAVGTANLRIASEAGLGRGGGLILAASAVAVASPDPADEVPRGAEAERSYGLRYQPVAVKQR